MWVLRPVKECSRLFRASAEKFIRELLLEKAGGCAIGFVNRNIGQCVQNFCPFQQSQRIKMAGNNQKHVKSFLQSPEPGLHRISYTKMSSILLDQIEEEGLNSFRTARQETRQEHGCLGPHQAHEGHVDYVKSGQHGHAHVSRFRDDEGGPRVLET